MMTLQNWQSVYIYIYMLQDLAPNTEYSVEVAVITSVGTIGPYSYESALYHRYCSTVTQEVVKGTVQLSTV